MEEKLDPRKELERLGYDLVYKPHEDVADHMAFYKVKYKGKEIAPPIVEKYNISLNEIWMSEKLRPYEKFILHHELQEIKYRAEGYGVKEAHKKASEDEKVWRGEPKYEKLRREINLVSEEFFTELTGFGETLYKRIVKNRPYFDIEEVKEVEGIGPKRFQRLKKNFWTL
ncbi:MAG: helix-hairpin-helix domain-containing protein [Candidatus Thermoplasmatota archaeon]|nr:helix-hairpin-helix domain-containing protein [Candidatus Thermoplasmatota archaeon]